MEEVWKVYYNSTKLNYEVSNFGNVKRNGKFYECKISNGYKIFYCNYLHRAVAELFIPNPENKPCIDHIDGNKLNNRVDNLRWVTPKENSNNPITKSFLKQGVNKHVNSINYINPMKNKHHTKESNEKNRISHLGLQVGAKNGMYNKHHTKESNEKNRLSHLNRHRIYYIDNEGNKKYKMSK